MELIGYIGAALIGFSLGLFGGGGAILAVPLFVYFFDVPPLLATSYSLLIVGATSAVGFARSWQLKQVDLRAGISFAIPSLLGVLFVRHLILPVIPREWNWAGFLITKDSLVLVTFSIVMLLAATAMILPREVRKADRFSFPWFATKALVVGAVTGFVGAGGGFLIVPALVMLAGLSMKQAVGTSLGVIAFNSLLGFAGDLIQGVSLNVELLGKVMLLALVGLFLGHLTLPRVSDQKLKPLFGLFVFALGAAILIWR
ncbi:Sulfite exporter TauE/SafE [compost metagenome]